MYGKLIQGNNIDNNCTYTQRSSPRADALRSEERQDSPGSFWITRESDCTGKLIETCSEYMFEMVMETGLSQRKLIEKKLKLI